jgi:hypothetical protein
MTREKHQIPSTKEQINSNGPNSKQIKAFWSFDIEIWYLFGICILGFGISTCLIPRKPVAMDLKTSSGANP